MLVLPARSRLHPLRSASKGHTAIAYQRPTTATAQPAYSFL